MKTFLVHTEPKAYEYFFSRKKLVLEITLFCLFFAPEISIQPALEISELI